MRMHATMCLRVAEVAAEAVAATSLLSHLAAVPPLGATLDQGTSVMNRALRQAALMLVEPLSEPDEPPVEPAPPEERPRIEYRVIELEDLQSAWAPERDGTRCKALLLEILRRAAHDWVLYRQHKTMGKKELAHDAYVWLFEEEEGHALAQERANTEITNSDGEVVKGARLITSFLSVCEHLGLDPETVRERVRGIDVSHIIGAGRTSEQRRFKRDSGGVESCGVSATVDVDAAYENPDYVSQYESYGAVATPSSLSWS